MAAQPARFGLAAKLFATLLLLGTIGVLITGALGFVQAGDALRAAILNQLTAARETKARQVQTYFRDIRRELGLLATAGMVVEGMQAFSGAVAQLDAKPVPDALRTKVDGWFLPMARRVLATDVPLKDVLPTGSAPYFMQDWYIVDNPQPPDRRKLVDDAGDGGAYSAAHATYHPLMRGAAAALGFSDLLLVDPKTGRVVYTVDKATDFGTSLHSGPYVGSNLAAAVARCSQSVRAVTTCLQDFADYLPTGGSPEAFMAAPIMDGGTLVGVLVARLSIDDLDGIITGGRRWRQEGFGASGEAYLVGPDLTVRSGPRTFYEDKDLYIAEARAGGTPENDIQDIQRYGTPVLQQRINTVASRAALGGVEGVGEIRDFRGISVLSSWGPAGVSGVNWAVITEIDTSEAFEPVYRLGRELALVGAISLLVVLLTGTSLTRSLLGPLRDLTAGVRRFAAGDDGVHVQVHSRDEIGQLCLAFNGMVDDLDEKNAIIESKNRENEELLLNILPAPIADRLREGEKSIADGFGDVTVAFADLVGFTEMSSRMPPAEVVALLNGLFSRFDEAARELGIEKIKTVGDAYMAVCGLPEPVPDHAARMARMAIRMVHITREQGHERRPQQRAGRRRRHRQEQVHLRPVGRHGESRQPHGIGRCPGHDPGHPLGLRRSQGSLRLRVPRDHRGQGQGERRGLAVEDLTSLQSGLASIQKVLD